MASRVNEYGLLCTGFSPAYIARSPSRCVTSVFKPFVYKEHKQLLRVSALSITIKDHIAYLVCSNSNIEKSKKNDVQHNYTLCLPLFL